MAGFWGWYVVWYWKLVRHVVVEEGFAIFERLVGTEPQRRFGLCFCVGWFFTSKGTQDFLENIGEAVLVYGFLGGQCCHYGLDGDDLVLSFVVGFGDAFLSTTYATSIHTVFLVLKFARHQWECVQYLFIFNIQAYWHSILSFFYSGYSFLSSFWRRKFVLTVKNMPK